MAERTAGDSRHSRVHFDPSLNLGHVLTVVSLLFGGGMIWGTLDARLKHVESQIQDMPTIVTMIQKKQVQIEKQQVQIEALGKQDDVFRETVRRMLDQLSSIAKDTAEIKGRLTEKQAQ